MIGKADGPLALVSLAAVVSLAGVGSILLQHALGLVSERRRKIAEKKKMLIDAKFAPCNGITFYYFPRSPCARRVWVTLLEKKIDCKLVVVDIMSGEQRNPKYLEINPQGKVPAIRVHNHPSLPDCILYESQAIVEWLDEQFPETVPLFPRDSFESRMQVKMWQYWELSMAEDMWPLSRQQVDGIIWRFVYSRESFYSSGPPKQASTDPFYSDKVSRVYEGTYLSKADAKRRALRTLRAFKMLDLALEARREVRKHNSRSLDNVEDSMPLFLVGDTFSQADIAAYPRLCKVPQNGLVSTERERALFPNVVKYFAALRQYNSFSRFADVDEVIWNSGTYPKFVPQWWGKYISWSIITAVGNFRAGVDFERITQASLGAEAVGRALSLVESAPLTALPYVISDRAKISFDFQDSSSEDSGRPSDLTENTINTTGLPETVLYSSSAMPLAVATRACLYVQQEMCRAASIASSIAAYTTTTTTTTTTYATINTPGTPISAPFPPHPSASVTIHIQPVDTVLLENLTPAYLQLMPFGEVPVLVHQDRVVYGPHLIVEFVDELLFSSEAEKARQGVDFSEAKVVSWGVNSNPSAASEASCRLLPSLPVERAIVRRWFGWCRTAYFYQIEPLYSHLVMPSHLLYDEGITTAEEMHRRVVEEGGVLLEDAVVHIEAVFGKSKGEQQKGKGEEEEEEGKPSRADTSAYIQELTARIDTVEAELRQASSDVRGRSLLGHLHFTYADYFVLSIVLLAEVYQHATVSPLTHPYTYAWKSALLADSKIAALYEEMCRAHAPKLSADTDNDRDHHHHHGQGESESDADSLTDSLASAFARDKRRSTNQEREGQCEAADPLSFVGVGSPSSGSFSPLKVFDREFWATTVGSL